jgi:hypothetical protein
MTLPYVALLGSLILVGLSICHFTSYYYFSKVIPDMLKSHSIYFEKNATLKNAIRSIMYDNISITIGTDRFAPLA